MNHRFIDRVICMIWQDTSGQTGNTFLHLVRGSERHDMYDTGYCGYVELVCHF